MEFCPKCGAILFQKEKTSQCPRCSYSAKGKLDLKTSEKINEKHEIAVIKDNSTDVRPVTVEPCEKCENDKAYFWTVQTRGSDEAETKFFQCTKCGHTHKSFR